MHFHLPKPLHGWREFTGEVGIIVIGVLIALAAEQVVEMLHWREQVAQAERAMSFELGDSVGQAIERERLDPCIERRLDEIGEILDRAGTTGRLPPVGAIGAAPYRTWVSGSWETTKQGQTASHFSRRELTNLGAVYGFIAKLEEAGLPEQQEWARLATISGPGRAIALPEIAALRGAAAEARLLHRLTTISAMRVRQLAEDSHIHFDAKVVHEYTDRSLASYPICSPIPAQAPSSYRSAPLEGGVERVRGNRLTVWG